MAKKKNVGPCTVEGCEGAQVTRHLCSKHYTRLNKTGSVHLLKKFPRQGNRTAPDGSAAICSVDGCVRKVRIRDLCDPHYSEAKASGGVEFDRMDSCLVGECGRRKLKEKPTCSRCYQLSWRYSLSIPALFEMHSPEVRVCSNPGCLSTERLHVDHDHSCCPVGSFGASHKVSCGGCVRGWLCHSCNLSLGALQENPRRIQGLLEYLDLHRG